MAAERAMSKTQERVVKLISQPRSKRSPVEINIVLPWLKKKSDILFALADSKWCFLLKCLGVQRVKFKSCDVNGDRLNSSPIMPVGIFVFFRYSDEERHPVCSG